MGPAMKSFIKMSYDTIVYRLDLMPDEQMRFLQWMDKLPLINRLDQGIPRHKYGLEFDGVRIYVSDSTRLHPNVRIRILSEYIQRVGWKRAFNFMVEIFQGALKFKSAKSFRKRIILSQVDLAYDFASDFSPWLDDSESFKIVTQHKTKRTYQIDDETKWALFGSGSAGWKVRLYNKLNEVKDKTEKRYWLGIWKEKGYSEPENVWRIEFELRNDFLKRFRIRSMHQMERMQCKVLQYCISFFHVVFCDNPNVSRCTWVPEFQFLRDLSSQYEKEFYDFTPRYFRDLRDNAIFRAKSAMRKSIVYSIALIAKLKGSTKYLDQLVPTVIETIFQRCQFDPIQIMCEVEECLTKKGFYYV
jgi:predicted transcriptional regulator